MEQITWERIDKGKKVMSIYPSTLKVSMPLEQVEDFINSLENVEGITVKYNYFKEKQKEERKLEELKDMFKDEENVIVFDPSRKK